MRLSPLTAIAGLTSALFACTVDGPRGALDLGDGAPITREADGATSAAGDATTSADAGLATPRADASSPADAAVSCGSCPSDGRCSGTPPTCTCAPGFVLDASANACVAAVPGSPALRTRAEVCAAFAAGYVQNASGGGFTAGAAMCDPGTLSREGLDDALRRLDFHRWLAGVGPASEGVTEHAGAQACALISAWNPAGQQAHSPSPDATCYSLPGAQAAGSSNIAWGNGSAASAIDQWIEDYGNDTTFGHRRWLLHPRLSDVGIGAYQGGNNYGSASCITVFGSSGVATAPDVIAYPPPGFVPARLAELTWTLQGVVPQRDLAVTVRARSSGAVMAASVEALFGNYGSSPGLRIVREGWRVVTDETYDVEITGDGSSAISYAITPISCP